MKRPVSHVCAIFVYAVVIVWSGMLWLQHRAGMQEAVMGLLCLAELIGALAAPRDVKHYWVGSVLLWMIALGALYDTVLLPGSQLWNHAPGVRTTWTVVIVNAVVVAILFKLPWEYSFSASSRAFFGLDVKMGKKKRRK
jgi:hypothetical protein